MSTDPHVLNLVQHWQELRRQGRILSVAELCADCPDLAEAVVRHLDALAQLGALPTTTATLAATPAIGITGGAPPSALPERASRFRLLGEIARGGMGVILRAHDPAIGRDVAIKMVLPAYGHDPVVLRRFFREARLAGQLQHPGVPPVYDVGHLPDGRPFFAMKLIEGRTLAALLRDQPLPGRDLAHFLRHFGAVCQTVGYAHARGIIHRDLKPLNVMVGAFGEVQVMDWGLAQVLREAPAQAEEDVPLGEPAGEAALTLVSGICGTPGYMAPEQVRCETERIDARSDVFALGAILHQILTGVSLFHGMGQVDLLLATARGALAEVFARLDGCGADAELVRLAKACLAPEPDARPADGQAVAACLSAVQDRLRQAEVARARAEEERKRHREKQAQAHNDRGGILHRQGRFHESEACFREAICLNPNYFQAHVNLGDSLGAQGRFPEAETAYREALRLKPDHGLAHVNLGNVLRQQGRLGEAEAATREALRLEPQNALAHCTLAAALQDQGRFAEALEAFRHGHALGSKLSGWRNPSAQWVRDAERLVELDQKLTPVDGGATAAATAAEGLELAALCQHSARRLHAAAVRLAAAAFAADPKLADDLDSQPRYNAACSAALAAVRQAEDARDLPDQDLPRLRQQALDWLRADLALYVTLVGQDDPVATETVRRLLRHWQTDGDLGSVRDPEALGKLSEAERDVWRKLWNDVDDLRRRAGGR